MPDRLFSRCIALTTIPAERVLSYGEQWYPVSEAFGLASAAYPAQVVQCIRAAQTRELRLIYEAILQRAVMISADDIGLYRGACNGTMGPIHYRLFEQTWKKLGCVTRHEIVHLPETKELVETIWDLFGTVEGGCAAFRVVEPIARRIVACQLRLCIGAEKNGVKIFTGEGDMDYPVLHLLIEGAHGEESEKFDDLLQSGDMYPVGFTHGIGALSRAFDKYWDALERHVLS